MADPAVKFETNDTEELVNQGIKAFRERDNNTAVTILGRAVELLAAEYGETHDELGIAYFYYGKALLELYREEVEPLGNAVPRELNNDSEDEPEGSSCMDSEPITENTTSKTDKEATTNDQIKAESTTNAEGQDIASAEQSTEEEEPTDLQVAWEVLELAKMIFDVRGESGRKELGEIFVLLGEISLESDNCAAAIGDMKRGLEIQESVFEEHSRTLAHTHYTLGVSLSINDEIDEALEHFNMALNILTSKISKLKENMDENSEEITDLSELVPDVEEKIADMNGLKEEAESRLLAAMLPKSETNGRSAGSGSSSSSIINNISHLIKRKRKNDDDGTDNPNPPKRPSE